VKPDVVTNGAKYLCPAGATPMFYLPCALSVQMTDTNYTAIITEGGKKALAIKEATGTTYLVIGLDGVWNWRTSDKSKEPEVTHPGKRHFAAHVCSISASSVT
jgi:hypothetical protein